MGITIGKAIPVHWVNTTYTSVDVIGSGGVYTGVGGSRTFRECKPGVNQLGQAGASITYSNDSAKEIKYVYFTVVPLDSVGSRLSAPVTLNDTGPIKPHAIARCQWDYMWQFGALKKILVESVIIEYMDGTVEEQVVRPKGGQKVLRFDPAMGLTWTVPVVLSAVLFAFLALFFRNRFVSQFWLAFILLTLATVFFSRKGMKSIAAVMPVGALAAFAAPFVIPVEDGYSVAADVYGETVAASAPAIGISPGALCVAAMCILLFLCAVNAIKEKKNTVMAAGFGVTCAVNVLMIVSQFIKDREFPGNSFIGIAYILMAALIWTAAIRCRNTQPARPAHSVPAGVSRPSETHKREEPSKAPGTQPMKEKAPAATGESEKAGNKIRCFNCGAMNNPRNSVCFACGKRLGPEEKAIPDRPSGKPETQGNKTEAPVVPKERESKKPSDFAGAAAQPAETAGKMHCPRCGAVNDAENDSCTACHTSFALLKAFKEAEVEPKKKETIFCPKCGAVNDIDNESCIGCNVSFELLKAFKEAGGTAGKQPDQQPAVQEEPVAPVTPELPDVLPDEDHYSGEPQQQKTENAAETADPVRREDPVKEVPAEPEEKKEAEGAKSVPVVPVEKAKAEEPAKEEPIPEWLAAITRKHYAVRREIQRQLDESRDRTQKLLLNELQGMDGKTRKRRDEIANARREEEQRQDELRKKLAEEDARYHEEIEKKKQEG